MKHRRAAGLGRVWCESQATGARWHFRNGREEGGGLKGGGLLSTLVLKNGDDTRSKKELTEEEQNELGEKQVVHIHIVFVYFAIGLLRLHK